MSDFSSDSVYDEILGEVASGRPIVIVDSAPGSGKTELLAYVVASAVRDGARVCVLASGYLQILNAIERLDRLFPWVPTSFWMSSKNAKLRSLLSASVPPPRVKRIKETHEAVAVSRNPGALFTVISKMTNTYFGDNFGVEERFDIIVIEEAWQMSRSQLDLISSLADRFVLIGDRGQIPPIVQVDDGRWKDSRTGPQRSAPDAIMSRNLPSGSVSVVKLGRSFRLPQRSASVVSDAFYRVSPFTGVADSDRQIRLRSKPVTVLERCISSASMQSAPAYSSLCVPKPSSFGPDRAARSAVFRLVERLIAGDVEFRLSDRARASDVPDDWTVVGPEHVAILVSRNVDRRAIESRFPASTIDPHNGLVVSTADAFQGNQRPIVVVLHPLVGQKDPRGFELDPGRLCVMLSRHQVSCFVIIDDGITDALHAPPDSDCVRLGLVDRPWEGWVAHRTIIDRLTSDTNACFRVNRFR